MKPLLPYVVLIAIGALLSFVGWNSTARFILWKINLPNLISRTRRPTEADDLSLTIVPLILGVFFLGAGIVLLVVHLLK